MGPLCGETRASGMGVSFICDRDDWNIGAKGSSLAWMGGQISILSPNYHDALSGPVDLCMVLA